MNEQDAEFTTTTVSKGRSETKNDTRIAPEDVFATAHKKEFIEEGKWQFEFEGELYNDVLRPAYLEGYIVTEIKHLEEDRIQIEVFELE